MISILIIASFFSIYLESSQGHVHQQDEATFDVEPLPYNRESWYRNQLRSIWDPECIEITRRRSITPENIPLGQFYSFPGDTKMRSLGARVEMLCLHEYDALAFRHTDNWNSYLATNSFFGKITHAIAHEFVHFAKHDEPRDLSDRSKMEREFYADLKALELLQEKDDAAYRAILHKKCNELDTGDRCVKMYPNAAEFLVCWGLRQHKKKSGEVVDLTVLIDSYLEHRDSYKKAIEETGFLKNFTAKRELSWQRCLETKMKSCRYSDYRLACLAGTIYNSWFVWDHAGFEHAVTKDAIKVARAVREDLL